MPDGTDSQEFLAKRDILSEEEMKTEIDKSDQMEDVRAAWYFQIMYWLLTPGVGAVVSGVCLFIFNVSNLAAGTVWIGSMAGVWGVVQHHKMEIATDLASTRWLDFALRDKEDICDKCLLIKDVTPLYKVNNMYSYFIKFDTEVSPGFPNSIIWLPAEFKEALKPDRGWVIYRKHVMQGRTIRGDFSLIGYCDVLPNPEKEYYTPVLEVAGCDYYHEKNLKQTGRMLGDIEKDEDKREFAGIEDLVNSYGKLAENKARELLSENEMKTRKIDDQKVEIEKLRGNHASTVADMYEDEEMANKPEEPNKYIDRIAPNNETKVFLALILVAFGVIAAASYLGWI